MMITSSKKKNQTQKTTNQTPNPTKINKPFPLELFPELACPEFSNYFIEALAKWLPNSLSINAKKASKCDLSRRSAATPPPQAKIHML